MGLPAHACPGAGLPWPLLGGCRAVMAYVACTDVPVHVARRVSFHPVPLSHGNVSPEQSSAQALALPTPARPGAQLLAERLEGTAGSSFHGHLCFLVRTFVVQIFYSI